MMCFVACPGHEDALAGLFIRMRPGKLRESVNRAFQGQIHDTDIIQLAIGLCGIKRMTDLVKIR